MNLRYALRGMGAMSSGIRIRRLFSAFLSPLMMISVLVSCGDGASQPSAALTESETAAVSAAEETEATAAELRPDLPDETYGGREFVLFNTFFGESKYVDSEIYPAELDGEALNDALYERCRSVEEQYDVKITDTHGSLSQAKKAISAGDDAFGVTFATLTDIMSCVTAGYAVDLMTMPYIDLEAPWWDQNAKDKLSFCGKLYYSFSDLIFLQLDNCRAFYFNKKMIDDFGLENPYDIVRDYRWTIDKMTEMGLKVVEDIDGDGRMGQGDRYGVMSWGVTGLYEALLTGGDAEIVKQGDDGIPYFYCYTERFADVYTKILDTMGQNDIFYIGDITKFMQDDVLFNCNSLNNTVNQRTMDTDFGILPVPMYEESQQKYQNVSPNAHAMFVPVSAQDRDFTGIMLEALSYESSKTVYPAYYDIMLKGKSARDNESEEMLDLIKASVSYVIKITGTKFSDSLYTQMGKNNYDIGSFVEKNREKNETALADVIAEFG